MGQNISKMRAGHAVRLDDVVRGRWSRFHFSLVDVAQPFLSFSLLVDMAWHYFWPKAVD